MLSTNGKIVHACMRCGLPQVARKLAQGGAFTVAFIGGSVTAGAGASDPERTSYRALVCRNLEKRFPHVQFTFINAAIGGTDSTFGAFRFHDHVLEHGAVDLLFIEFAVNDGGDRRASIRAMEGLVRRAKNNNTRTDICFLYTPNQSGAKRYCETGRLQDNIYHHEEVAGHYGLPSVHIAGEIYTEIQAGKLRWEQLSSDEVHPDDYGHALYGQCVQAFLEQALGTASAEIGANGNADVLEMNGAVEQTYEGKIVNASAVIAEISCALPQPLDPFCYEGGKLLSPLQAASSSGWKWVEGWTTESTCNWEPPADLFIGERIGESFCFNFTGTAVGFSLIAGMDTGGIEFSIDGGSFEMVQLFDRYCTQFHRPKMVLLKDELCRGEHSVEIRISNAKHEDSCGHAVRIINLLINS
ncbi:SGNH/GDSL hydrolase family protein [Paenibacillus tarimensis]